MTTNAIAIRPAIFRQVMPAEESIKKWKVDRKIHIDHLFFHPVMPMMKPRSHEAALSPLQLPAKVRVNKR